MLVDHVLTGLGGRTAARAIEDGAEPAMCGGRCAPTSMYPAISGDFSIAPRPR